MERPHTPQEGGDVTGRLILAGTPIGNAQDASPRLRSLLATADVVAAEDTRRVRALAARLEVQIAGKVVAVHDHNEADKATGLLDAAESGATVVLVSDAGMPTVSDPGYRLVTAAIDRGVTVTTAPGPSAVLAALAVSGLATDRFTFEGFAPRRDAERRRVFAALAAEERTMVFFEAPHRVAATLAAMAEAFGADRRAVLARELTKTHEEVRRASVSELAAGALLDPPRGEIVLVVAGAPAVRVTDIASAVADVLTLVDQGMRLKDAAGVVAQTTGMGKRDLYDAAVAQRRGA